MANTQWSTTDKTASVALSNANLTATSSATAQGIRAVDRQTTGKFYWEIAFNTFISSSTCTGFATAGASLSALGGATPPTGCCIIYRDCSIYVNGVFAVDVGANIVTNGIVCIALDLTNRLVWFRSTATGNWNNNATFNPATGVGGIDISPIAGAAAIYPCCGFGANTDAFTGNFGDSAFGGVVPSGFTSGFTAGAAPSLNAVATLVASEQWIMPNADAQATQVLLEMWAPGGTTTPRAVATLVALEQWASSGLAVTQQQARALILA